MRAPYEIKKEGKFMTGHKKWLAVLSGAFALWMIGGCSLKNVENLQETGKILSETVEDISETSETDGRIYIRGTTRKIWCGLVGKYINHDSM